MPDLYTIDKFQPKRPQLLCPRIYNILSTHYLIISVILQRLASGPSLFNIYLMQHVHWKLIALYADDATICSSVHHQHSLNKNVQNSIDIFISWCILSSIKFNKKETTAVYFCDKFSYPNSITMNNVTIPWTNNTKYLVCGVGEGGGDHPG